MTLAPHAADPALFKALDRHSEIIESHWIELNNLLNDQKILEFLREKQKQNLLPDSLGFNLFRLISEIYYRENLHSDFIAALLDPSESHGAGHRHVHAFINWLKKCRKLDGLNVYDFEDVEVEKEKHGRVDIVIRSKFPNPEIKKAIIIENKINGAPDMERQLPRYLDNLEQAGYEVAAIVYLNLIQTKDPNEIGWLGAAGGKDSDHDRVHRILIKTIAYSHHDTSMVEWIRICENEANNFDALASLRQYRQLIQHLGAHAMNETLTGKFYDEALKSPGFLANARSLAQIMNDLPQYRASRLKSLFDSRCSPFTSIALSNSRAVFMDESGDVSDYLRIDVQCFENASIVAIWDRDYNEYHMQRVDEVIDKIGMVGFTRCRDKHVSFPNISESWIRTYKFPEDETLLEKELAELIIKISSWRAHSSSISEKESKPE